MNGDASVLTRRGFLKAGAATTAVLIAGGMAFDWLSAPDYAALIGDEKPEVLSAKELAVLMALAARVVVAAPGAPSAAEARVARRLDRELVYSDGVLTGDVRASLALLEHGPLLDGRGLRFTNLSAAEQDAYLADCNTSALALRRAAWAGLRSLCLFFYYTDDRTWPAIGYSGPWVPRKLPEAANSIEVLVQPVQFFKTGART